MSLYDTSRMQDSIKGSHLRTDDDYDDNVDHDNDDNEDYDDDDTHSDDDDNDDNDDDDNDDENNDDDNNGSDRDGEQCLPKNYTRPRQAVRKVKRFHI